MTHKERTAIIRVLRDLIKADAVIDSKEIHTYAELRRKYKFTQDEEVSAATLPLAEAVDTLAKSEEALRKSVLQASIDLILCDGFCSNEEALMLIALMYCLQKDNHYNLRTGKILRFSHIYFPLQLYRTNIEIFCHWDKLNYPLHLF